MTRAITAPELAALRSDGQWARWRVLIDRPNTLYTARVNGALNKADWSIPFDGGVGTLGDCLADMTLLIGSTPGGWDGGMARLRKAPAAGVFYIGANDALRVSDNDYLTVLNDFLPLARHPVGEQMDVDVAYTDQHSAHVPTPVMGERVAVIRAGETVGFDASASWGIDSDVSGYAWYFQGASATSGTSTATPTATYNAAGRYRVGLIVTAENGKTAAAYGWVYALGGSLGPESGVVIGEIEAEAGGGWSCELGAYDIPEIRDLARVVIYSEDYFGNEPQALGPVAGRENILMVGWIIGESIVRAPGQDMVGFTVGGPAALLEAVAASPMGLIDPAYPDDDGADLPAWSRCASLSAGRALHHLIHYRSTLAAVIDVEIEDWAAPAGKLSTDRGDLWGQLGECAEREAMQPGADRHGHVYIQRPARLYPLVNRAADIPVVMTVTGADWGDELAVVRRNHSEVAVAEAEGVMFAGGIETPVGGRAPGDARASHGGDDSLDGVCFASPGEALELAGLLAGALNAEYGDLTATLMQNNRFIDIAPRQYFAAVVDGQTVNFAPDRLSLRRDDRTGAVSLEVEAMGEGGQWDAVSIEYPGEGGAPAEPPSEPPTEPPPPEEGGAPPPEAGDGDAVVVTGSDVRSTSDLSATSPTWTTEL